MPARHLGLEHGGILNWAVPLTSRTPVFAAALQATQEFLERMDVVPRGAFAEQSALDVEDSIPLHCEACAQLLGEGRVACGNPECEIVCCPSCVREIDGEANADFSSDLVLIPAPHSSALFRTVFHISQTFYFYLVKSPAYRGL